VHTTSAKLLPMMANKMMTSKRMTIRRITSSRITKRRVMRRRITRSSMMRRMITRRRMNRMMSSRMGRMITRGITMSNSEAGLYRDLCWNRWREWRTQQVR